MPRTPDPELAKLLAEKGITKGDYWDCHGTWVVYHRALEKIAAREGIKFDAPASLETNSKEKIVAICVTGHLGEKTEWSIGEAAPGNNKNAYPYAMAEKRGKDRVILKLIGLHGLVYSEDEMADAEPQPSVEDLVAGIAAQKKHDSLVSWYEAHRGKIALLNNENLELVRAAYRKQSINLSKEEAA